MPGGHAYGTENGCFAKTFGLDPDFEPSIYGAVVKPTTYLENVVPGRRRHGGLLQRELHEERPRGLRDARPARATATRATSAPVDYLLILNRNENIIPAVAKLSQEQAAAYFMLGETTGTARRRRRRGRQVPAGARHEPVLPSPPRPAGEPPARAPRHPPDRDLPAEHGPRRRHRRRRPFEEAQDPPHLGVREGDRRGAPSSFDEDPDFGYQVATTVPDLDDAELLQPRTPLRAQGRGEEYARHRRGTEDASACSTCSSSPSSPRRSSRPSGERSRSPVARPAKAATHAVVSGTRMNRDQTRPRSDPARSPRRPRHDQHAGPRRGDVPRSALAEHLLSTSRSWSGQR